MVKFTFNTTLNLNIPWCDCYGTSPERIGKKNSKAVLQFDFRGKFIKRYESTMQAQRETGVCNARISESCLGNRKHLRQLGTIGRRQPMTREEAAKLLEKQFDESCGDYRYQNKDKLDYEDALWLAIAALQALDAQENPEPLTLEELRQMNGEPVWIVEHPDWGHWELAEDAEDYLMDRDEDFYGMKHNDPLGRFGLHVLGWLAYRHKPKEETK